MNDLTKFCIALLILLLFAGITINTAPAQNYYPSKGEQLVNTTLATSAKIIKEKYDIQPCGSGAAMPGGPIQELTLCFDTMLPYTKEQLRELVIKTAHELLNQVTINEEIQQYIKEPPFTLENIHVIIFNHDKNGRSLYDPDISNVQIMNGILSYASIDPDDTFKYKNEYEESYEEALKILSSLEESQK